MRKITALTLIFLTLSLLVLSACKSSSEAGETDTETESAVTTQKSSETETHTESATVTDTKSVKTETSKVTATEAITPKQTEKVSEKYETPAVKVQETQKPANTQSKPQNKPVPSYAPTEAPKTEPATPPETKPSNPEPVKHINATAVSVAYSCYQSSNEPQPYVKGTPIYGILYSGTRAQVGDKISFSISVSPSNSTDSLAVEASDGLSYTISGNTLTISANSDSGYGAGNFTLYALAEDGHISASVQMNLAIDKAGNPFADLSSILSGYITAKNLYYTSFSEGYTTANPSLSITGYADAPAWDDMIDLSEANHIERCLWLIDRYKAKGFTKVNFIVTETSVGFCAA